MKDVFTCARAEVFYNPDGLTATEVQARTGCTHIINGWVFLDDFTPCNWIVSNYEKVSQDEFHDYGISCPANGAPTMSTDRTQAGFLSGLPLLKGGQKLARWCSADVGRSAERTIVGWLPDGKILLWCDSEKMTPDEAKEKMLSLGAVDALMMDGGGSVQGIFPDTRRYSSRIVLTFILFWEEEENGSVTNTKKVVLDAGHDASNLANKSPDGTYYEHEFALDMAQRIRNHLVRCGVEVTETRPDGKAVSLADRCKIANAISGLDLFVSLHSNAVGGGWSSARGWSCYIYAEGGNREKAARAILQAVENTRIAVRTTPIVDDPSLYVLKNTNAPAVLIEHAFHTNMEDVACLKDNAWRTGVALAEAKGIVSYLGLKWVEEDPQPPIIEPSEPTEEEKAIAWANSTGVMTGYADGEMHLDNPVTRRQLLLVAYRLAKLGGLAE